MTSTITWADDRRRAAFEHWIARLGRHGIDPQSVRSASADASFRRYFRVDGGTRSYIVMDAPPAHEDCRPFVKVAGLLRGAGLNAPQVLEWDEAAGFMLLSDLGSTTYLAQLDAGSAPGLYDDATSALVRMQQIDAEHEVPPYDEALLTRELQLFPDWYIDRHSGLQLSAREQEQLQRSFALILRVCLAQPRVLVHRDYHSRNLMVSGPVGSPENPGILDFQDAVWGPITYDLVSLLRDAYIEWEEEQQIDWAVRYWEKARKAGLPVAADFGEFWRDFEWMGLQRHLKVLGIFCRLNYRDGKDGYLKDLPLVWRYAHRVATRYSVLTPLARLLERLVGQEPQVGYTF
ncbi:aminoglycoside phosphotransferase family protein [Caldimonas thermodepolymerans]|jgi:Predicted phosphotransferase related to Ser/Thr protein kinases|uniref:aminoglycoside phosphotransferase family protein n=1 Tax=Caldimonas thermodepolymerans TaxID=215580 RepID=UPI0024922B54|nr:phosphotransferase [Caldimonas thermodepolymerans]